MQVRCRWEPGSESRPLCWRRRESKARVPSLGPGPQTPAQRPGGRSAAVRISRRINKLPPGRQDLTAVAPLLLLPFPSPGSPLPTLLFSRGLLAVGAAPGARSGGLSSLPSLPRAWRSIWEEGFGPHPTFYFSAHPQPLPGSLTIWKGSQWGVQGDSPWEEASNSWSNRPRGVTFLSCGPSPLMNGTEAEEGKRKPPRSARGEAGPPRARGP